jgi:hypothetical protein
MIPQTSSNNRLWKVAGGLVLAFVALVFGGTALETSLLLGDPSSSVRAALVESSMAKVFTGGYIEYLGFLVFLVAATLLARLLRGTGETSGWLSSTISAAGVGYTTVTIASGFAAGAAALYDGHHGASLETITAVNDVRNFGFFMSVGLLGVFTLAVAGAIQATGALPRWLAWSGYVIGVLNIAAVAAVAWDAVNEVHLIWFLWFVTLGVVALRGPRTVRAVPREAAVARA